MHAIESLRIVCSYDPGSVEFYAATELKKYLTALYHLPVCVDAEDSRCGPAIFIGSLSYRPDEGSANMHALSADGFSLKTLSEDPLELLIIGGSGRGVLFGVYEFIERHGVRFLLSGDIFPEEPVPLRLSGFNEVLEPAYSFRAIRPMANLPEGAAPWSFSDFVRFIDQMAKLKLNTFVFVIMESGPWLDYEFRDMRRPAGDIFYGYRFPIGESFVGQSLFGGAAEFYSPVLASANNDEERKRLGIELVRSIIKHCKSRGLQTLLTFSLLEPPSAFKHACNRWSSLPLPDPRTFEKAYFSTTPVEEFGVNPEYAAWMNVLDPVIQELTAHRLKALIATYPEADFFHLWVSEHRAGVVDCEEIFAQLDSKYHLRPQFDFKEALDEWEDSPFDRERFQNQMKGDLLFLYALDKVINEHGALRQSGKPDSAFGIAGVMPQLTPILNKILSKESVSVQFLDYGAHGPAERLQRLDILLDAKVPTTLEIGIHDDNDMYFPQASTGSLERIVQYTAGRGAKGYVLALWQVRQADLNAAFIAQSSWRCSMTPEEFWSDLLPTLVGAAAVEEFNQAQRILEQADRLIRRGPLYGFAFPMTDSLIRAFVFKDVDRAAISEIQPLFQQASNHLDNALGSVRGRRADYIGFWVKRTKFALDWLEMAIACGDLGRMLGGALAPTTFLTIEEKAEALELLESILERTRALIELIVSDARHIGDLGQIANMNRNVHGVLLEIKDDIADRSVMQPLIFGADESANRKRFEFSTSDIASSEKTVTLRFPIFNTKPEDILEVEINGISLPREALQRERDAQNPSICLEGLPGLPTGFGLSESRGHGTRSYCTLEIGGELIRPDGNEIALRLTRRDGQYKIMEVLKC